MKKIGEQSTAQSFANVLLSSSAGSSSQLVRQRVAYANEDQLRDFAYRVDKANPKFLDPYKKMALWKSNWQKARSFSFPQGQRVKPEYTAMILRGMARFSEAGNLSGTDKRWLADLISASLVEPKSVNSRILDAFVASFSKFNLMSDSDLKNNFMVWATDCLPCVQFPNNVSIANIINGLSKIDSFISQKMQGNLEQWLISWLPQAKDPTCAHIANTVNGLARFGFPKSSELKKVVEDWLLLHLTKTNTPNDQDVANTVNGLAKLHLRRSPGFDKILIDWAHSCFQNNTLVNNRGIASMVNNGAQHKLVGSRKIDKALVDLDQTIFRASSLANSQHIANTVNGLAQLKFNRSAQFDQALLKWVHANLIASSRSNSQDIANTVNGLAQLKLSRSAEFDQALLKWVHANLIVSSRANSQDIANTVNGLAQLELNRSAGFDQALLKWVHANLGASSSANSQEIANTVNGLAQLKLNRSAEFDQALLKWVHANLIASSRADSQHIANTVNGLAQLKLNRSAEFDQALLKWVHANLIVSSRANSQSIANTVNGLAQLKLNRSAEFDQTLLEWVHANLGASSSANSQEIANTVNGLAQLKLNRSAEFDQALLKWVHASLIVSSRANSQHIANTVNGLAQLNLIRPTGFDQALLKWVHANLEGASPVCSSQHFSNTINGLALLELDKLDGFDKVMLSDWVVDSVPGLDDAECLNLTNAVQGIVKLGLLSGAVSDSVAGWVVSSIAKESLTAKSWLGVALLLDRLPTLLAASSLYSIKLFRGPLLALWERSKAYLGDDPEDQATATVLARALDFWNIDAEFLGRMRKKISDVIGLPSKESAWEKDVRRLLGSFLAQEGVCGAQILPQYVWRGSDYSVDMVIQCRGLKIPIELNGESFHAAQEPIRDYAIAQHFGTGPIKLWFDDYRKSGSSLPEDLKEKLKDLLCQPSATAAPARKELTAQVSADEELEAPATPSPRSNQQASSVKRRKEMKKMRQAIRAQLEQDLAVVRDKNWTFGSTLTSDTSPGVSAIQLERGQDRVSILFSWSKGEHLLEDPQSVLVSYPDWKDAGKRLPEQAMHKLQTLLTVSPALSWWQRWWPWSRLSFNA